MHQFMFTRLCSFHKLSIRRDGVGNRLTTQRTQQTQPTQTTNYDYNDIYELTGVTGTQANTYDYDAVGNRELVDSVDTYTSNSLNQYMDVNAVTHNYDGNGNLTYNGTNMYVYDRENRLTDFNNGGGGNVASYKYDALNRRVAKTVDGVTTLFVYDGDSVIEEYDSLGGLEAEYVLGSSIDEVLTMERGGTTYYYHYDGLGSVTEITDNTGTLIENYTYTPYGVILSGSEGSFLAK
ncbi:MAG: RHS repeat protein [Candidatus Omnitrophica bacterium]|nr:RHS repeat protein [Candidatus Omnitrophota bacterium]